MATVRGSFEVAYGLLPQYCDQVRRTNPGSTASVHVNPNDNCFRGLFISFQASIIGFANACRPLIGLDKTPLKSKYFETFLFAFGFDGDAGVFPLAFMVIDEENDENWMWFLSELHNLLEINTENLPKLTILSDRQKSVVDAVEATFPTAFHGFCMRHISNTFHKQFNNTMLVNLPWEAAQALTNIEFEAKILEIGLSKEAAYCIRCIPPRLWATAFFEGARYGHLTGNIVELLNSWIVEASGLTISKRRDAHASMQWNTILVPSAEKHVSEALDHANSFQVLRVNEAEFEIISHTRTHVVDIQNSRCACGGWQLHGLPCVHAVAALLSCRQNVHRFTGSCFTVATYRKAYSQTIHPIPHESTWKELSNGTQNGESNVVATVINPPKTFRPPGRPRKNRVQENSRQVKQVVHCSRCNRTGHFRTTCSVPI